MEFRKLQKVGNRSYSVTLPKNWISSNKLKEKDSIFISESNNSLNISLTKQTLKKTNNITSDINKIEHIPQFLVFCYVNNVETLKLLYKKENYEKLSEVKQTLTYLEGYTITNEDEHQIEISFVFQDINLSIKKILRRLLYLLKLMEEALEKKDINLLESTELMTDKLYHLSKRVLLSCLNNPQKMRENELLDETEIFFYKEVSKRLERLGDNLLRLKNTNLNTKEKEQLKNMFLYLEKTIFDMNYYDSPEKCVKHSEKENMTINKMCDLSEDIFENMISIKYHRKYFLE